MGVIFAKYGILIIISILLTIGGIALIINFVVARRKRFSDNQDPIKYSSLYCSNCGEKIVSNACFCRKCGLKIDLSDNSVSNNSKTIDSQKRIEIRLIIGIFLVVVGVATTVVPVIVANIDEVDEDIAISEKLTRGSNTSSGSILLDDKAGLVASSEVDVVLKELLRASSDSNCNIVVLTTNEGLTESTIKAKSESYYKNNIENKVSTNYSIVLTVDIITRKVNVSCYNESGSKQVITETEAGKIREGIVDELSEGKYDDAFKKYAKYASEIASSIDDEGHHKK